MYRILPILTICAMAAISCQKENAAAPTPPTNPPAPTPVPVAAADVSIASVTILEDCPDAPSESAGVTEDSDSEEGWVQPCRQSTMQIAIRGQGDVASNFAVREVRLLGADDAILGVVKTRGASLWNGTRYSQWDQTVAPSTDVKASYKLSLGDWSAIEKALGKSSYGPLFVIEADVSIGAVPLTIRSSKVAREPVEMIDT
jgi:hypothetical protein